LEVEYFVNSFVVPWNCLYAIFRVEFLLGGRTILRGSTFWNFTYFVDPMAVYFRPVDIFRRHLGFPRP